MNAPHPHTVVEHHLVPPPPTIAEPPLLLAASAWRTDLHPRRQEPRWPLRLSLAALAISLAAFAALATQAVAR